MQSPVVGVESEGADGGLVRADGGAVAVRRHVHHAQLRRIRVRVIVLYIIKLLLYYIYYILHEYCL